LKIEESPSIKNNKIASLSYKSAKKSRKIRKKAENKRRREAGY